MCSLWSESALMAALVNFSQPRLRWEAGRPQTQERSYGRARELARTVKMALSSKTPCFAQFSRLPFILEFLHSSRFLFL